MPGVMVEVVVVEVVVGIVAGVVAVDMLDLNPIPHLWYVNFNITVRLSNLAHVYLLSQT